MSSLNKAFLFMVQPKQTNKQNRTVPGSCLDSPSATIIDIIQKYSTENRNINHEKKLHKHR